MIQSLGSRYRTRTGRLLFCSTFGRIRGRCGHWRGLVRCCLRYFTMRSLSLTICSSTYTGSGLYNIFDTSLLSPQHALCRRTRPQRNKEQSQECMRSLPIPNRTMKLIFMPQLRTAPQSCDQNFENSFNNSLAVSQNRNFFIHTCSYIVVVRGDKEPSTRHSRLQVEVPIRPS